MTMKTIKGDVLRIQTTPFNEAGDKLEPEERPAERAVIGEFGVSTSDGQVDAAMGLQNKGLRGEIAVSTTAGQLAKGMSSMCFNCKHFDNRSWHALKRQWEFGTPEQRAYVQAIREQLVNSQNIAVQDVQVGEDGDVDVEHGVMQMGLCQALTEMQQDVVLVHPTGTCPEGLNLFQAADHAAEKRASQAYDHILRLAEGRK